MSIYPNTFYRVSLKALVIDSAGRVLLCQENSDNWSLPGGGLDHGESPIEGLRRELNEELGIGHAIVEAHPTSVHTIYVDEKQAWLMWIVYAVKLSDYNFTPGPKVRGVMFKEPHLLDVHNSRSEKLVYDALQALAQS